MLVVTLMGFSAVVVVRLALRLLSLAVSVVLWLVVAALVLVPLHVVPGLPFH